MWANRARALLAWALIAPVSRRFEKLRKLAQMRTHPASQLAKPIRRAELCCPLRWRTSAGDVAVAPTGTAHDAQLVDDSRFEPVQPLALLVRLALEADRAEREGGGDRGEGGGREGRQRSRQGAAVARSGGPAPGPPARRLRRDLECKNLGGGAPLRPAGRVTLKNSSGLLRWQPEGRPRAGTAARDTLRLESLDG
jgi:hypothetical protein